MEGNRPPRETGGDSKRRKIWYKRKTRDKTFRRPGNYSDESSDSGGESPPLSPNRNEDRGEEDHVHDNNIPNRGENQVDNGQLFEVQPCEVEVNVPEIEQIHDPDDCNLLEQNNEGDSDIQHDAGDESVSGGEDYGGHDADLGDNGNVNAGIEDDHNSVNNSDHDSIEDLDEQEQALPENDHEDLQNQVENGGENVSGSEDGGGSSDDGMESYSDMGDSSNDGSEEEEDNDDEFNYDNEPIFNGSTLTFRESALAILSFILAHRLTGLCLIDLLALLSLHCGPGNLLLKSLFKFKKYFKMIGKDFIKLHYFCSVCETPLPTKNAVCHNGQENSYFIEFPLLGQLQNLFCRPGFFEKLQYRFGRVKKDGNNLEDIYDGSVYQFFFNSGFLSNPHNISFLMYFDGVSIFKSSSFSIWPVFLSINELKYKYRTSKENTLLAGLWFGRKKPNPNVFLCPLKDALASLENDGVSLKLPGGERITVRAKLLCAVADMPAKSLFMRFIQYNGAYSCFHCLQQGGRFGVGLTTVQVFPYIRDTELRTIEGTIEFGEQALQARAHDPDASIYGVKGTSVLTSMLPNMILCMGIDIMHGVFLGAMRTLMNLWFDSQYKELPFSIYNLVHIVDARLKNIKPPYWYQKVLPSIKKDLSRWKAIDFKVFFFYYSIVVLHGVLPEIYWIHHVQFVAAISVLNQESISSAELDSANDLLHLYVADFQRLYGLRHLTLTFHQLLHLISVCKNLGPAWVFSCFTFESLNGQVARLIHGSRHVALQICSATAVYMKLPVLLNAMQDTEAKALCIRFQEKPAQKVKVTEVIDERAGVLGKFKLCYPVPPIIRRLLSDAFNIFGGRYSYFYRLKINGLVYSSEEYVRSKQKKSCFVEIYNDGILYICKVISFIRWSACGNNCNVPCVQCEKKYFCLVAVYDKDIWELHNIPNMIPTHLSKVHDTGEKKMFPIQAIRTMCIFMPVDNKEYIGVPINNLEVE